MAHPGRGKPGKPLSLSWLEELEEKTGTTGLPLFDWADRTETGELPHSDDASRARRPLND